MPRSLLLRAILSATLLGLVLPGISTLTTLVPVALSQKPTAAQAAAVRETLGEERLRILTSPKGNYVELLTPTIPPVGSGSAGYVVERAPLTPDSRFDKLKFKRVATVTPPASAADIIRYLDPTQAEEYATALGPPSVDALAGWMRDNRGIENYGVFYELSEVRQATGHMWLDESATAEDVYMYRLREGKKGRVLGSGVGRSGVGNVELLRLRPRALEPLSFDSTTVFKWSLAMGDTVSTPWPTEANLFDQATAGWTLPNIMESASLRGRVYVQENGRLRAVDLVVGSRGPETDTITFTHSYSGAPGARLYAYLVPEDFVYNAGVPSDTVYAFQRSGNDVELVYWAAARDTTDAVVLTWSPLEERPELAGVMIVRTGLEEQRDTLGIFSAQDMPYIDRDIDVGTNYVYEVSAAYLPGTGLVQEIPATTAGTYLAFEWPLPPHQLRVAPSGENVQLNWKEAPNASRFGYRIFRGTRPDSLSFASGPIMDTSFVDTAAYLDGRSTYYYAVQSVNLRQDTSVYSEVVSIRPQREVYVRSPQSIDYYFASASLIVSWDDVRRRDNTVEGYRLERRVGADADYEALGPVPLTASEFRDTTTLDFSASVSYRVTSIDVYGNESPPSADRIVLVDAPAQTYNAQLQNIFYLQSLSDGIAVSWPVTKKEGRQALSIQRRAVGQQEAFTTVAQVPITDGYYLDADASATGLYEYAIRVVMEDGEEGVMGTKRTIRR